MTPDLSFVIPTYNDEAYVAEAINSCLAQKHKTIEVICVDDGSTDSTPMVLSHFADKDERVRVVTNPKNLGRGASRNIGNEAANAPIIAVLDADDVSDVKRAQEVLKAFKEGGEFLFHGAAAIVDLHLKEQIRFIPQPFDLAKAKDKLQNYIVHSTVAYPKSLWQKFPYDRGEYQALGMDDWHQQIRMALAGVEIKHTTVVLSAYRQLGTGISKTRDENKVKELKTKFLKDVGVIKDEVPAAA